MTIAATNSAGTQGTWLPVMFHSGVDVAVDVVQGSGTGGGGNGARPLLDLSGGSSR